MSFDQLVHVTKICHDKYPYFKFVMDWFDKRQNLAVYLRDIPVLVKEYKNSANHPYSENHNITIVDQVPRLRLSNACESATNCLYSLSEIAAQFGNEASEKKFPASFNNLRKNVEKGDYSDFPLAKFLGDFQWYKKVREIRTEWAHYSSLFIGGEKDEPIIVIRCRRKPSERHEFRDKIEVKISELLSWINRAIATIDGYGDFLLVHFILPRFDLKQKLISPKYDKQGFPIFKPDKTIEIEEVSIEQHLLKCGIMINPKGI